MKRTKDAAIIKRVHITVSGLVQGVGFRSWILENVDVKTVTGWVTNYTDGSVGITAEARKPQLMKLIAASRKGPAGSIIRNVCIEWGEATGEPREFGVLY